MSHKVRVARYISQLMNHNQGESPSSRHRHRPRQCLMPICPCQALPSVYPNANTARIEVGYLGGVRLRSDTKRALAARLAVCLKRAQPWHIQVLTIHTVQYYMSSSSVSNTAWFGPRCTTHLYMAIIFAHLPIQASTRQVPIALIKQD